MVRNVTTFTAITEICDGRCRHTDRTRAFQAMCCSGLTCVVDQVDVACICSDDWDQVISGSLVSAHGEEAIPCALIVLTQKPLQVLEAICMKSCQKIIFRTCNL